MGYGKSNEILCNSLSGHTVLVSYKFCCVISSIVFIDESRSLTHSAVASVFLTTVVLRANIWIYSQQRIKMHEDTPLNEERPCGSL